MAKKKFDLIMQPDHRSGKIIFSIDKHDEGTVLDTGWIKTGLEKGSRQLLTAVSDGEGPLYFGSVLFSDAPAALKKLKLSAAVREDTSEIRFAVKLKNAGIDRLVIHFWQPLAMPAVQPAMLSAGAQSATQQLALPAEQKADIPAARDFVTPTLEADPEEDPNDGFYIENAPATLHGGWKYTLRAHLPRGAEGKPVRWELTDGETAGTIDGYGCYTAPQKPGAYEVKAYLDREGLPALEASVYLIVL